MSKTTLQMTAFNETLAVMLNELRSIAENIPPDGVTYLPIEYVDPLRKFTRDTFLYDDSAWVNGIDMYKMNSILRHLRTNKQEYRVVVGKVQLSTKRKNATRIIGEAKIQIPTGWDGRDGMFIWSDNMLKHVTNTQTNKSYGFRWYITQNKTYVDVMCYSPDGDQMTFTGDVYVIGLLWRNKGV